MKEPHQNRECSNPLPGPTSPILFLREDELSFSSHEGVSNERSSTNRVDSWLIIIKPERDDLKDQLDFSRTELLKYKEA